MPTRSRSTRWPIWALSLLLVYPAGAAAQESTGTITGHVTTPDGRPIAGATVTARAPELIDKRVAVSSALGAFSLPSLPPGRYVLSCELAGHVTTRRTLTLSAREMLFADFQLHAAPRPEDAIIVTTEPFVVADLPPTSTTWRQATLETLPVVGGLASAIALTPALTAAASQARLNLDGAPLGGINSAMTQAWPNAQAFDQMSTETSLPSVDASLGSPVMFAVTRAGGDRLWGSARATIGNANNAADDLLLARRTENTTGAIEGALGGPIRTGRVWLFGSGRHAGETVERAARLAAGTVPERLRDDQIEAKVTAALNSRHRFTGLWLAAGRGLTNTVPDGGISLESANAAVSRDDTFGLLSGAYSAAFSMWTVDARLTREWIDTELDRPVGLGGAFPVFDLQTRGVAGGGLACSACENAGRGRTVFRVATSALIASGTQLHRLVAGYEGDSERWNAAGQPEGGAFSVVASRFRVVDDDVVPVLDSNGSAWIVWRQPFEARARSRGHSLFIADEWRVGSALTIVPGLRWTRESVTEGDDAALVETSGLSPSVQVAWQPAAARGWRLNGGFARIAADPFATLVANGTIAAPTRAFLYSGPPINVSSTSAIDADTAAAAALAWFQTSGSVGRPPFLAAGPGLTLERTDAPQPHWWEWSAGADRVMGDLRLRADFTSRHGSGYLARRLTTQRAADGGSVLALAELVDDETRDWTQRVFGAQADYRVGIQANVSARYAWSRESGFAIDRGIDSLTSAALAYPSFAGEPWAAPGGIRAGDSRHHLRLMGHADVLVNEDLGSVSVDVLQSFHSGARFGVSGWTAVPADAGDAAFAQQPVVAPYAFTAGDAFGVDAVSRTDLGIVYRRGLAGTVRGQLIVQFHILNLFNHREPFMPANYIAGRTSASEPGAFAAFDPRSDAPVQGVNWDLDPRLQDRMSIAPVTLPRAYRLSITVRF
ncbi:MAG TPA: TonB-dependent receptor [Vicinamibacterales bacterium]|nr:TonB-dependent receptor [Vicinamibacterales bacterium]